MTNGIAQHRRLYAECSISKFFALVTTVAILLLCPLARAQNATSPAVVLESGIERDINRYQWVLGGSVATRVRGWDLSIENKFVSDALILFQDRLSFRDSNRGTILATRPLLPGVDLRFIGISNWYSLSRVYNQHVFVGTRLTHGDSWIEPRLGYSLDARPGVGTTPGISPVRRDAGPAAGFRAHVSLDDATTYRAALDAGGSYDRITPRRSHRLFAGGTTVARFEQTQLSGTVSVTTTRRDAYQATSFLNRDAAVSEAIEATTSDTLAFSTSVTAPVYRAFSVSGTIGFGANARRVRNPNPSEETLFFETNFGRRDLEATVNLDYKRKRFDSRLTIRGGIEEEQRTLSNRDALPTIQATQKANLLRQADFDRGYYSLTGSVRAEVTDRITVTSDATINLLRHDTPEVNPDDRDERFARGQVGVRGIISRYFSADVQVFATQYETVYLKAVRSAENNVQRSLRLRPGFNWTPSRRTNVRIGTEIRATYTVDDFLLGGRRPRDQAARELQYDLEGEHAFDDGIVLRFTGEQSELRLGRFFEDSFSEIPFDTLQTTAGWLRLQVGSTTQTEIGIRLFQRRDFNQSTRVGYNRIGADGNPLVDANGDPITGSIVRPGKQRISQIGPTCAITWPLPRGAAIRLEGWLTFQHVSRKLYGTIPEIEAAEISRAAKRGTQTTIPNLAMTVSWRF